ncbi:MAG: VWA domain-containing protein [Anaerolineales bacterium]|jgi:VWFA-related protein|nr:VWA domain-containing protein [Anaerolineales bacterium]HJO33516.1 VWA domain-containing protein [Anaerolineales bacterium]|tara:strand:+ start:1517 stop:3889 length:2373 start_codon:yes stop_codon:yes gene_type:complete
MLKKLVPIALACVLSLSGIALAANGISVAINFVEAIPDATRQGYDVTAYVSVLDASAKPIVGLTSADFALTQDGVQVTEFESSPLTGPMSLVLAIDVSGSMRSQGRMDAVKDAGATFLGGMTDQDQSALLSFSAEPKLEHSLTRSHADVLNLLQKSEPTPGASTCLWDAAYEAGQLASSVARGRRAVILLTDGYDETLAGDRCSTLTVEDVIQFASKPMTRVPFYTIGVGNDVNVQDLTRVADLTGGRSLFAPETDDIDLLFADLSAQLRQGYQITYFTSVPSGDHELFVQLDYQAERDQDVRSFRAPPLPPTVKLLGLENGQTVTADVALAAMLTGDVVPTRVEFFVGEQLIADDTDAPFETNWSTSSLESGPYLVAVKAYDTSGALLASREISLFFDAPAPATSTPTKIPSPEPTLPELALPADVPTDVPTASVEPGIAFVGLRDGQEISGDQVMVVESTGLPPRRVDFYVGTRLLVADGDAPFEAVLATGETEPGTVTLRAVAFDDADTPLAEARINVDYQPQPEESPLQTADILLVALLAMAVIALVGYRLYRRRSQTAQQASVSADRGPSVLGERLDELDEGTEPGLGATGHHTRAKLSVFASADPGLNGQDFEIWEQKVVIGRSQDADICLPVQPVSRIHAEIRLETVPDGEVEAGKPNTSFFLHDTGSDGQGSQFGSFVHNEQVPPGGRLRLTDHCEIRIGRTGRPQPPVRMRFRDQRRQASPAPGEDATRDDLALGGMELTNEGGASLRNGDFTTEHDERKMWSGNDDAPPTKELPHDDNGS